MASEPTQLNVMTADNFDSLGFDLTQRLSTAICNSKHEYFSITFISQQLYFIMTSHLQLLLFHSLPTML